MTGDIPKGDIPISSCTLRSVPPQVEGGAVTAPLAGIRVLDLSRVLAGPYCTMILGDLGAEVIKVERPGEGDDTRHWGPPFASGESAYYLCANRNKKSVTVDMKTGKGKALLRGLAEKSDVLIENFRVWALTAAGRGVGGRRGGEGGGADEGGGGDCRPDGGPVRGHRHPGSSAGKGRKRKRAVPRPLPPGCGRLDARERGERVPRLGGKTPAPRQRAPQNRPVPGVPCPRPLHRGGGGERQAVEKPVRDCGKDRACIGPEVFHEPGAGQEPGGSDPDPGGAVFLPGERLLDPRTVEGREPRGAHQHDGPGFFRPPNPREGDGGGDGPPLDRDRAADRLPAPVLADAGEGPPAPAAPGGAHRFGAQGPARAPGRGDLPAVGRRGPLTRAAAHRPPVAGPRLPDDAPGSASPPGPPPGPPSAFPPGGPPPP